MPRLLPLDLDAGPGAALLERVSHAASANLAAVATRLARAFFVISPFAPGLRCVGAEVTLDPAAQAAYGAPRISVTGNGETPEAALTSCLGEAVDRLAVVERPGDVTAPPEHAALRAFAGTWIAEAIGSAERTLDWIEARDIVSDEAIHLPADVCLRRAPERRALEPAGALSTGVAAGADFADAALRAALELCERDAAALWWLGGRRPAAFPLEHPASKAGARLIENLRQGARGRQTLLLDIGTDLGIPVAAAASFAPDGRGLACGFSARLDWANAARSALLEMCQMELAAPLAEAKRAERGEAALNDIDRRHLRRAASHIADCPLLQPQRLSPLSAQAATPAGLQECARTLAGRGVALFAIDLTRPEIGVAAARVVSPQLQPYAAGVVTDRLRQCRAEHGRLHEATAAIPLL